MMMMMVIWTAVFVVTGAHFGRAMQNYRSEAEDLIQLDMAPNSVDDMYNGCDKEMKKDIVKKFLPNELNNNPTFQKAWKKADDKYKEKWNKSGKRKSKREKEQIMAMYAYTLDDPKLYREFNEAVRNQKPEYETTFKYHTMHYYLTRAIQSLNPDKKCTTAYRKVDKNFSSNVLNKEFRFSSFTSGSFEMYIAGEKYGWDTCFEIYTCFGAKIDLFSEYENEREVLIPPYEVFKVTYIGPGTEDKEKECKVVYKVKSTEKSVSNLNCTLFPKKGDD